MRIRHDNAGPEKELRFLRYQVPTQDFKLIVISQGRKNTSDLLVLSEPSVE